MDFNSYQELAKQTDKCVTLYYKEICTECKGDGKTHVLLDDAWSPCQDCEGKGEFYLPLTWVYPTLGLAGEMGEVAEKIKKSIRDDLGHMNSERRELLIKELGDCLWYIAMVAEKIGVPFNEVAEGNLDKLFSRKARGVLSGDGDKR